MVFHVVLLYCLLYLCFLTTGSLGFGHFGYCVTWHTSAVLCHTYLYLHLHLPGLLAVNRDDEYETTTRRSHEMINKNMIGFSGDTRNGVGGVHKPFQRSSKKKQIEGE